MADWFAALQPLPLTEVAADPDRRSAIFSADMIVGFCDSGNLASARVDALTGPVVDLFTPRLRSRRARIRPAAGHARSGHTRVRRLAGPLRRRHDESETIPELAELPFSDRFTVIPKNSLGPGYGTTFDAWLDAHPRSRPRSWSATAPISAPTTWRCTCGMRANARNIQGFEVIVPANAVDTYDLPPEQARAIGAFAHPGDFFHQVFLYHMALNGIRVVSELT